MKPIFIIHVLLAFTFIALANRWILSKHKGEIEKHNPLLLLTLLFLNLGMVTSLINPINALIAVSDYASENLDWNFKSVTKSSIMLGISAIQMTIALLMSFTICFSSFRVNFVKSDSVVIAGVGWILFFTFSVLCHLLFQNIPSEFLVTPSDFNFN